ncbi:HD domain-containing protein [Candidatus Gribaldobacteria bacterium]|nr:HD domain-containing protein [Candidatus Gribaldobacteria bacterium]
MQHKDLVYGEFEIEEPIILELINSPYLQRLKYIDQAGYRKLWVNSEVKASDYDHSRFAHSLGVYSLLKKYNAPLAEQIAGLLHDVSHSAFSHCIDYALEGGSQTEHSHQDNYHEEFINKTDIPDILKKYNFDLAYILDDGNFPLKEKNLPDLCADRLDYSLKTAVIFGELNEDDKNYILSNLIAENNHWVFKSYQAAKKYGELFLKLNIVYYAGLPSAVMFRVVGDYLKYSLARGYINYQDLYTTDKEVLEKISRFVKQDKKLYQLFERMNGRVEVKNNPADYEAEVFCKSRIVDPLFKEGGALKRLSEKDIAWSKIVLEQSVPKKYFLQFEFDD